MGVLDAVFSSTETTDDSAASEPATEQKYAILMNAGPDQTPTAGNAMNYALELDDAGYEVGIYLDGKATRWPGEFAENPDQPFNYDWEQIRDRGLIVGACGYCANAFEAVQACDAAAITLLSDTGEHAPSVAELAEEGYELVTV